MPLRPPSTPPKDQRDWDQWARSTVVTPDNSTVTTAKLADNAVTNAKLRNSAAASVIGRPQASPGDPQDIPATSDSTFLVRRAGALVFDDIADDDIPASIARNAEVSAAITAALSAEFVTGTYLGAFTGTTTDPEPTIKYTIAGRVVVLQIPPAFATSNATSLTITGAPTQIHPQNGQPMVGRVRDSGASAFGMITMGTDGTLTLGLGAGLGTFTNTGQKGVETTVCSYSLD